VFLFAPFLAQLEIADVVREAALPGTRAISALNYLLSFPKCTALSTYSYSLDASHLERLQAAFVKRATKLGLYEGNVVNLDFHPKTPGPGARGAGAPRSVAAPEFTSGAAEAPPAW
jgi:hypothetical protein